MASLISPCLSLRQSWTALELKVGHLPSKINNLDQLKTRPSLANQPCNHGPFTRKPISLINIICTLHWHAVHKQMTVWPMQLIQLMNTIKLGLLFTGSHWRFFFCVVRLSEFIPTSLPFKVDPFNTVDPIHWLSIIILLL